MSPPAYVCVPLAGGDNTRKRVPDPYEVEDGLPSDYQ